MIFPGQMQEHFSLISLGLSLRKRFTSKGFFLGLVGCFQPLIQVICLFAS